ncbi:MAG: sensor histidine kinase [Polaribacter sp.]|uniref:ATP-binding protein n=1 Tax=Polaribacter sp. TaxID=1920175 RepID=UPI003BAF600A
MKIKLFLILGVFFFLGFKSYAQKNVRNDSVEFYRIIKNAWEIKDDYKNALQLVSEAKKIAFKKPDSLWLAQANYYEAIFYYYAGEYQKTLKKCDTAKVWYPHKDNYGKASVHNLKGLVYTNTDNYIDAINEYQSSLFFAEKTDNLYAISNPNHNIGILYQNLKQYNEALKYFLKALEVRNKIKDSAVIYQSYLSVGGVYNLLKVKDSARFYLNKITNSGNKEADFRTKGFAYNNIGLVFREENNSKKAIENFNIAVDFHLKLENDLGLAETYKNLAEANQTEKEYKKSNYFAKKAIFYAKKVETREEVVDAYEIIAQNYDFLNKKDSALYFYNQFIIQKDSLIDETKAKKFAELQIKYDFKEKETELLKTRTEKAETELALSKTQNWIYILLTFLAIAAGIFFAISQRTKRKNQEAILKQKELGFKAIIEAQEEERSKIARELHDGVVQQIGSIILKSRNLFSKKNVIDEKKSNELLDSLENSNQELRNISHQMMPRALKELGIIPALSDLLVSSLGFADIHYNLEHFNINARLPQKIEVTIYRITQELINNIIKHSKATEVSVQLFNSNNNIILIVEDNGVGFVVKNSKKGIGLLNISSRLDLVNGNVNFEPSTKSGTLVTIKIPL